MLYICTLLFFYKHQHDNRVTSKLCVTCQLWWFIWWFWLVSSVPEYTRTLCHESLHTTFERIVRLWLFPEFDAEFPMDNCNPTIILISHLYIHTYRQTANLIVWTFSSHGKFTMFASNIYIFWTLRNFVIYLYLCLNAYSNPILQQS